MEWSGEPCPMSIHPSAPCLLPKRSLRMDTRLVSSRTCLCNLYTFKTTWSFLVQSFNTEVFVSVPFCRTRGLLGSPSLGAVWGSSESAALSPGPSRALPHVTSTPSSREPWPQTRGWPDLPTAARTSVESTAMLHRAPPAGDTAGPGPSPSGGSPASEAPGQCCPG